MCRRLSSSEAAALLAGMDKAEQDDDETDLSPAEQLALLQPPRPIDIIIQPESAVVVITGK